MDNYDTGIYTDNPDDTLRYMRSTQAVAMVRCKDCCYWAGVSQEEHALCTVHDNVYAVTPRDGFCHKGRRSE